MLERLTLLWKRYSPLEDRLLAEVRQVLPPGARAAFDAQVAGVTRIQRSPPAWSEICFYRMRRGRVDWSDLALFPCTDEIRLAEVRFVVRGQRFRSALSAVAGHIFDFSTVPGPKAVAFTAWEAAPHVALLADPLRAPTGRRKGEILPAVWEKLLQRPSSAGAWETYDRSTAYRVTLSGGEYLVLAERGGDEFILYCIEPPMEGLLYLPHHDGTPEPLDEEPGAFMERN